MVFVFLTKEIKKMTRIREIKKYGQSYAIKLEPADMKDYTLVAGDTVDVEDMIKQADRNITKILKEQKERDNGSKH